MSEMYDITGLIFAISFAAVVLTGCIIAIAFAIKYLRKK